MLRARFVFSVRFTNLNTNRERGTQKREQLYWQIVGNPGIVTGGCGVIALGPIADEPVTDGGVSGAVAWDDRLGGAPTPDDAGVPMFEDPILPTPVWPSVPMPEPMPGSDTRANRIGTGCGAQTRADARRACRWTCDPRLR